ncbi:hypothetical protein MQC88_08315 [Luteimonas sp. 50]|uniref:Terminase large subunit gp17-like C-terminal domain-containing protein n=1 Tax=Cognatiluteimonas sedimenti TaxID=2927791 RepID=A0ABT0A4P6_9GAMM|nr:hypothetical protein [Lysobacter sedimenti]MCJ0825958.1 hypothetical protein [Lysobacter sedimenti]
MEGNLSIVRRRAVAVGIDVGQAHDPTAIAIVSRITTDTTNPGLSFLNPEPNPRYEVQHLERLRLGMPYPAQVDHVEALLCRPPLNRMGPRVLVDYTGVGRPVFDMFAGRHALRRAQGVVITGGRDTTRHGPGWSVPKGELVSKLQALLHAGELRIAASLPDAPVLLRELQDFRVRFTESGNATFNAREGAHDDLVLALALAVFGLSRPETVRELDVVWGR